MDVLVLLPYVCKLEKWRGDKAARANKEIFVANRSSVAWDIEPSRVI